MRTLYTFWLLLLIPVFSTARCATVADTLYCGADVTITAAAPNFMSPGGGRQGFLSVGYSNIRETEGENRAYLRFNLNGIDPAGIERAELHLWKTRSRSDSIRVYSVEVDTWDEYETVWLNAPPMLDVIASGLCGQGWSVYDVGSWVKAQTDDEVSFGLRTVNPYAPFLGINSREGGAPPMLVVHHAGPGRGESAPRPGFPSTSSLEHGVYINGAGGFRRMESIQSAVQAIRPGEEIVLGPGVYYESFTLGGDGTPEAPLKIRGDGDPRPAIDGSLVPAWQNSDRGLIRVIGKNWIIEHLDIRNAHPWGEAISNSGCFYIHQAENTVIRDCGVYFGGNGIFSTDGSGELTVENCEVAYNSIPHAGYEHAFYVNNSSTVTVRFSHIHHNGGMNFKTRAENCVFAYNYVHSPGNYQLDFSEGARFTDQDAVLIGNTIVTDNRHRSNEQFIVFGENRRGGSLHLYNNTFIHYYPVGNYWVHMWIPDDVQVGGTTLNAWNNVFYFPAGSGTIEFHRAGKPVPVIGSSNWFSSGTTSISSTLRNSILGTDPLLSSLQAGDFRPRSGSPLVDAGDSDAPELPEFQYRHERQMQPRQVRGAGPDIGAFEYVPGGAESPGAPEWDFNGDGRLGLADVILLLLRLMAGEQSAGMDVDGDGTAGLPDAVELVREVRRVSGIYLASTGHLSPIEGLTVAQRDFLGQARSLLGLSETESLEYAILAGLVPTGGTLPRAFRLEQNYPNPFNPSTTIVYHVPQDASVFPVSLNIYDLRGRLVRSLVERDHASGRHTAFWDGTDGGGQPLPSGVYLYRLRSGDFSVSRKMILMK